MSNDKEYLEKRNRFNSINKSLKSRQYLFYLIKLDLMECIENSKGHLIYHLET